MADHISDRRDRGWYWIDNALVDDYGITLGPYGVAIYNELVRHADENGQAFPSLRHIEEKLGIGRPKVIATLQLLERAGLLHIAHRVDKSGDSTSNLYTLLDIRGGNRRLPPPAEKAPEVVTHDYHRGNPRLPEQDLINNTGNEEENSSSSSDPCETSDPSEAPCDPHWARCLSQLRGQTTRATYNTWLHGTTAVRVDGRLIVTATTPHGVDWLSLRLRPVIERTVTAIYGQPLAVDFVTPPPQEPMP